MGPKIATLEIAEAADGREMIARTRCGEEIGREPLSNAPIFMACLREDGHKLKAKDEDSRREIAQAGLGVLGRAS
jgi:hypothetical protein